MLICVEAMHCLGEGNPDTQATMIGAGHFDPIVRVLTQTRYQSVQVIHTGSSCTVDCEPQCGQLSIYALIQFGYKTDHEKLTIRKYRLLHVMIFYAVFGLSLVKLSSL